MADDTLSFLFEMDAKMAQLTKLDIVLEKLDHLIPSVEDKTKAHTAATEKLDHALSKANGHLKEHGEGFKGIGHHIDHTKEKLIGFLEFTGAMVAFELIEKLTDGVIELGKEIVKAAAAEERIGLAFKLNLGDEAGEQALKYAEQFSKFSEFTEDQAKQFALPLLQAGVPLEKLDMYMAAAGDVASKSANKIEGMMSAVEALRRVELSGKLEGRALRSLNIGVPQLKELEEFRGKTDKQIKDFLEKGSLTKEQLFRAIAGADHMLGDNAVKASETMSSKLDKLKALPERLFQGFMNSPAFDTLKLKIDHVLEKFDPDSPGGQKIIKGIGTIAEKLLGLTDKIDLDEVMKGVLSAIEQMPAILEDVKQILDVIVTTARGFGVAIHAIRSADEAIAHPEGKAQTAASVGANVAGILSGNFAEASASIYGILSEKFRGIGQHADEGMSKGMAEGAPDVAKAAMGVGSAAESGMRKELGVESPSKVFRYLGDMTAEGFIQGFRGRTADIDDVFGDGMAPPASIGRGARTGGTPIEINNEINVTVSGHGGDAKAQGEAVAAAVRETLPSVLIAALDRIRMQQGSS